MMYTIYVTFTCHPGKREAYVQKLHEGGYLDAIRNEEGCKCYDFYFSEKDKNTLLLIEMWESKSDQEQHMTTPHMAEVMKLNGDYIVSAKLGEFTLC